MGYIIQGGGGESLHWKVDTTLRLKPFKNYSVIKFKKKNLNIWRYHEIFQILQNLLNPENYSHICV